MDDMDVIVYDPVDQKAMKKSEAYAEKDGLFFATLETQQMYYRLIESGFEVVAEGGKPMLRPRQPTRIWEKELNLRSTSGSGSGHLVVPGLQAGDYTLHCEVPELTSSLTGARKATIKMEVTGGDGRTNVTKQDFVIDKQKPTHEVKFSVTSELSNGTLVVDVSSNSLLKTVHVKCMLDFLAMSKIKKEIADARRMSKTVAHSGEHIVELTKGTTGVGMTLGWDRGLNAVTIRSIEENGAAARTKKLKVGDFIIGIQGTRLDGMSFKQVIKLLRNVPTTVVMLIKNAPEGYRPEPSKKANKVRQAPPPVPPAQQPAAPAPAAGGLEKYDKMKKAGLPEGAIRNAMMRDGVEAPAGYFDAGSAAPEPASAQRAAPPPIPASGGAAPPPPPPQPQPAGGFPGMAKYEGMRKAGLPEGAIRNAMMRDGVEAPAGFFGDSEEAPPVRRAAPPPVPGGDGRAPPPPPPAAGGLLAQIQAGAELKHADAAPAAPAAGGGGGGGGLLAAIQAKPKLRPTSERAEAPPPAAEPVNPLLAAIKARPQLKAVDMEKVKEERRQSVPVGGGGGLGNAIMQALDERRNRIGSESDEASDDEWDDDDEWAM